MAEALGPKMNVVALRDWSCDCGCTAITEKAIYFCEELADDMDLYLEVTPSVRVYGMPCSVEGCLGFSVLLREKRGWVCTALVKPLNDGDTSLVKDEQLLEIMSKPLMPHEFLPDLETIDE